MNWQLRSRIFKKMLAFARQVDYRYHCLFVNKRFVTSVEKIAAELKQSLASFLDDRFAEFSGYDVIKVYYDHGQAEVNAMLKEVFAAKFGEVHPDFKKGRDSVRRPENGVNPLVQIVVLYGCVSMAGIAYRAKTTLKRHIDPKAKDNQPTKAYSYEINNIEVMAGTAEPQSSPTPQTSMDVSILLNGVCDVNGVPLLKNEDRRHQSPRSAEAHAARSAGRKR